MRVRFTTAHTFEIQVNGTTVKTINETEKGEMMKRVWKTFNNFAHGKKLNATTELFDKKYFGLVAWSNEAGDVVSLVQIN